MNKTELENKISELEKMICELKDELEDLDEQEKMPKGEIWQPTLSESFYSLDFQVTGGSIKTTITEPSLMIDYIEYGNHYRTLEKAEFEANREKYTRLFRQYVEQHSEPLDWEDDDQMKWCCYYDYDDMELYFDERYSSKDAFNIYASSKEVLQDAIEFVGESNFKKYILEVE